MGQHGERRIVSTEIKIGEIIFPLFYLYLGMKFLFSTLFILWACCAWSQNSAPKELTFSRVILLDSGVVPVGKVWKVESYLPDQIYPSDVNNYFWINGRQVTFYTGGNYTGGNFGNSINIFPFWLPAGATIESRKQFFSGQGLISVGQFSILEFNEN